MAGCAGCGRTVEASFRFCPWCAEPQRRKLVEFFRAHPRDAGRALRVSRYYGEEPQVRFSVWDDGVAQAAVSLEEEEARRVAAFLAATSPPRAQRPRHLTLLARARDAVAGHAPWLGPMA